MKQNPSSEANSHSVYQEIRSFYGTRSFINVFTWAFDRKLFWGSWIQSAPSYPVYTRSVL